MKKLILFGIVLLTVLGIAYAYECSQDSTDYEWYDNADSGAMSSNWDASHVNVFYDKNHSYSGNASIRTTVGDWAGSVYDAVSPSNSVSFWFLTTSPLTAGFVSGIRFSNGSASGENSENAWLILDQVNCGNSPRLIVNTPTATCLDNFPIATNTWHNFMLQIQDGRVIVYGRNSSADSWIIGGNESISTTYFNNVSLYEAGSPKDSIHIDDLAFFNWTVRGDCLESVSAPTTGIPTFVFPTLGDGTANNTNQTINMSCGDDVSMRYTLWFDENAIPLNDVLDNSTDRNWTMNISVDDTYYYSGTCFNTSSGIGSTNSSVRTFIMDTTTPTITINPTNFFNTTNMSTTNQYLNSIAMNMTFTDNDNIFAIEINITKDGVSYFGFTNTSINEPIHNYTKNLDITSWPSGVYDINITVADGHHYTGGYQIGDYEIEKKGNKITFDTTEGNKISISSTGASSTQYTKEKNSYAFGFGYSIASTTRTFDIESKDGKIYYLPTSRYKAHFVVWNGKHGNWVDFEELGGDYTVKKINDYKYQVTFTGLPFGTEIISKSIGGLNVVTRSYQWYRGTYDVSAPQTYSTLTTNLTLNITKNNLFIDNVSVTVSYNNIAEILSQTDYGSFIIYNVTVTAPIVSLDSNIPYSWNITINQTNGDTYNFTLAGNNVVLTFGLDDCTNTTVLTLNVTFKNISTDNYVNVNLDYVFEYRLRSSSLILNFSGSLTGNNQTFCIFSNHTQIISDILFEYNLVGSTTLFDYSMFQINLTNVTQLLTLYTQEGTTQILFTVLDIDSNPIINAYIHILQYDIATNTYQTTEVLKTDSQGQALGNTVLGTYFYNFFIYYLGDLVYTEQAVKVISTTRTFKVNLAGTDWFDDFETTLGVITSLIFNNVTNNFVYTWTDSTSSMHQACLRVDETNRTGKFELDTTCVTSASGTILYNIPVLNAGSTYTGTGYLKFDFPMITNVVTKFVTPLSSFFNISQFMGLFIAFLFCMTMVMIGLPKPSLSLTFLGIGVLITSMLGLWAISLMQVTSIIFLMIIQLYLMRNKQ